MPCILLDGKGEASFPLRGLDRHKSPVREEGKGRDAEGRVLYDVRIRCTAQSDSLTFPDSFFVKVGESILRRPVTGPRRG